MPTLLEKMEADAARRLVLPPNRQPAQELARYKNFLKVENHRLKIFHRGGGGGLEVCQARAAMMDVLLRYLAQAVQRDLPPARNSENWALVAIGGYGRGELNPRSDIDFMFLHDGSLVSRGAPLPYLKALTEGVLYTLWDIGLKVGHATRSIGDCVTVANSDMQSKTSLIEARLITGNESLFKGMRQMVRERCVKGFEKAYIAARLADQATRRAKFGNSACMQEPNIKNGCGGLRDYQNLLWMTSFKYRLGSLSELEAHGQITATERKQMETAYDFLLRARTELHYHVDRAIDVLPKSLQPTVAHHLGYLDRSPMARLEKFMRDFYTHARTIDLFTRTLEQRLALLKPQKRLPSLRGLWRGRGRSASEQGVDGFQILDGEIHAASRRVFRDQPRRLMRVFLYTQQRGLKLHPELAQWIRQELALVNRVFLADEHVHETFLEILNQRGNVAHVLRAMHEVGLLGKFLPEFGKLTCLVQHEFYHQYAADEHTLMCLEKLDQIRGAEKPPFNHYTEIFQNIERPFVLYLALLLHDAGKAIPGRQHAEVGSELAARVARRLKLAPAVTESLRLVIEHHLMMVQISQRRDLDDPAVIHSFAGRLKTAENLDLLTLHTFADSMGTSDKLWNDFKETLLWTLHQRTSRLLRGGTDFIRAQEKQREQLAQQVRRLATRNIADDEIAAHLNGLPARYCQIHTAEQVTEDVNLVHRLMAHWLAADSTGREGVVNWHHEPNRGYSAVQVCTWDLSGLFSKIAGSLTAAGLNILSAQIFSREDGIILDTFFVHDAHTGKLANREEREKFERLLQTALTDKVDFAALIARQTTAAPLYRPLEGERIPTVIHFDHETSASATVIDVETEDRVGLLYTISHALAELGLDISLAKISTEKGAAIDTFYVTELEGAKIVALERLQAIERKLRAAVAALDAR
ncbi:MAG: [protein-PII] uridylyltransferase [Verrucomicrobia bacterium]|nr:[protein-PII] uridylyltransferase [Verrucomicrobiota bacterium]